MREIPTPTLGESQQIALRTMDTEVAGVLAMRARVASDASLLHEAVALVLATKGRVVVVGIGKSGHVGRKIAATLASTGTPAMFVHPAEASHGDLGMITEQDVVLAISNSGEVEELLALLPALGRIGVPMIAMTGNPLSSLARHARCVLDTGVPQEACPLNLAPTASTTAQLVMGDALAVCLLDARGFREEDFARSHPGGALGRRLLTHVRDLMRAGDALPAVAPHGDLVSAMRTMSVQGFGAVAVVDAQGRLLGVFTDGDLRRLIEAGRDLRGLLLSDVMRPGGRTVRAAALAVEAARLMEEHRITRLFVVDEAQVVVGAINSNDLLRAKVI
jgi:arabinose-5-phosphate isomerase